MKKIKSLLVTLAAAGLTAAPAQAALLINGGFESPTIGSFFTNFGSGSTDIPGWTVGTYNAEGPGGADNVDIVNAAFTSSVAAEGSQFLDLVGFGAVGSIYQTFATIPGQIYLLSFAFSHNSFGGDPSASADFALYDNVSEGDLAELQSFSHNTGSPTNLDWQRKDYWFTARGTKSTLSFNNTGGGTNAGVLLDDVSVSAVPEPAVWLTMIVGFALVGGVMRRRRTSLSFA